MARAAQSLRRGDVAAAAAAVPAVIGSGSLAAAAGANYGRNDATTRLLPNATTTATAAIPRKRNPWTWPLIALVAILAVVLIATLIALLANPGPEKPPASSSVPATGTQPSATPTNNSVTVDADEIKGKTQAQVEEYLTERGLRLDPRIGRIAPEVEQQGRAYLVDPEGSVPKNTIIAVTFYADIPTPPKPGAVDVPAGPHTVSETVTVTWSSYAGCPTGFERTGYVFTVVNATMGTTNPLDANANSLDLELPGTPGSVSVSYHVTCGDLTSPESDVSTITVE
jgi:hypothetical protein